MTCKQQQLSALLLTAIFNYENLTKKLGESYETLRWVWKLTYKDLKKILGIRKFWTYKKVMRNLGKS